MSVTPHRIANSTVRRTAQGWEVEDHYLVENIGGPAHARTYNAMIAAGVPAYGAAHPTVPNVLLEDIECRPEASSNTQFDVRLIYREPQAGSEAFTGQYGPVTVSYDVSSLDEQTRRDINGDIMLVTYRGNHVANSVNMATGVVAPINFGYITTYKVGEVSVSKPAPVMRLSRKERNDPLQSVLQYVGTVNSTQWRDGAPKTWLLRGVRATPERDFYRVEYEFAYAQQTWSVDVAVTVGNDVPQDAVVGNGLMTFDVYGTANFVGLAL